MKDELGWKVMTEPYVKMINFHDLKKRKHQITWPKLAANFWSAMQSINNWAFESGKANLLFNLISHHHDIDKIYLYAKNPYETKNQSLINNKQSTDLQHLSDSRSFYWMLERYGWYLI